MREGERSKMDSGESTPYIIPLDDPGKEEVDVPPIDDSRPVWMASNSQILLYVNSMHLLDGHPFRDIVDLLRMIPLSCDTSTLEKMEWVQNLVLTPVKQEIQYIKEMEVARRSLVVSSLLPPISRLELNEWSKFHERGEEYHLLEVQRREVVFDVLMNTATQVATTIHSISYHPDSSDSLVHPTDVFSVDTVRSQLARLFVTQQSMNESAYQAILRSCQKKERLLLFHLDSILSYVRISLQLLVLTTLHLPSLSLSSLLQSLHTLSIRFPKRVVISTPRSPSPSSHSESIYQPLLNCLRTAFLGLQTMEEEGWDRTDEENEERLRNYRSAINSAFDVLLCKKETLCVNKQMEPVCVDKQDTEVSLQRAESMVREEEDGVMYIYQGVSCDKEQQQQRRESPIQHRNRQIQSDLVREVTVLQQRRMKSMPVKVIGELPPTEEPKPEAPPPSLPLPNLFSYLSKPKVEMDRLES